MKKICTVVLSVLVLFLGAQYVHTQNAYGTNLQYNTKTCAPDVEWLVKDENSFSFSKKPIAKYTGETGVTVRSFSKKYTDEKSLKPVYDELMKNGIGEEISYLSYIDLIGDYPYGFNIAGKWYGMWYGDMLAKDRYIEIYGCDTIDFTELARSLSHEYGHHFTYYYIGKKEKLTPSTIMNSGFAKIRKLSSYEKINNGDHTWDPSEIAAEDYVQLFGSNTGKASMLFEDARDQAKNDNVRSVSYTTLVYNLSPQENTCIKLAWQVPGLYQYWSELSGVTARNNKPPIAPILALTSIKNGTYTLSWTKSIDDTTRDMEYTLVSLKSDDYLTGIRTTTDSKGRDAIIGTYKTKRIIVKDNMLESPATLRVYAKDSDGNIVSSNDVYIDPANPDESLRIIGTVQPSLAH